MLEKSRLQLLTEYEKCYMDDTRSDRFDTNSRYKSFLVTKALDIPELQCRLIELVHEPSGALIMHIANDDPENLFCLSFRTLPESSNGVAHVLEHTVLCGSDKYPVRDPFFAMNRRSLNTFMNALTGADFTCYPAASQVEQDFYNLLEVYLDSVFHPLLQELSFSQEGCRLEFSDPLDPTSPLEFKGVVFNEMKGSLASPTTRLIETLNATLFPNSPYGYNSGGDPSQIPNLSYEELLYFHKNYYHPSRCLFFFYGNLPLKKHLDFISHKLLKNVQKMPPLPPIPKQQRFLKPVYKESFYPISADEIAEDKTIIAYAWLTCHILDQISLLALSVLDIALMDNDASPLKLELLRSGLCKQANSLMDSEVAEIPYGIVIKGCKAEDAQAIEEVIFNTLKRIAQEGLSQKLIDSALHQLELYRSEITGDSAPFGLSLFSRAALLRQHGGQAEDGLRIHSLFEELRTKFIESPRFLSELIIRHFLTNNHYVRLVLNPSTELATEELTKEAERLQAIRKSLTLPAVEQIIERSKALEKLQEEEDEIKHSLLPKISLDDVPKEARTLPLSQVHSGLLEVFHHNVFTNNIVYADLVFPVADIREEDLWLVRLFSMLLPQVGSGLRQYQETLEYQQENTGGIGSLIMLNHQAQDGNQFMPSFHLRGRAMYHKAEKFFSLLFDMATAPNFTDRKRLKELILKHYTNLQSSFVSNALKYAMNLSASGVSVAGKIHQAWYGLDYLMQIKKIASNFDELSDSLINDLERIKGHLLCTKNPNVVLACDQTELTRYLEDGFQGLSDLPGQAFTPWKGAYKLSPLANQGRIISSQVSFTSKVCSSISYSHPAAAAITLAAFLFDNVILHKRIREQGGAYGAGSVANIMAGTFSFYSYRDPNITSTVQAFDEAIQAIQTHDFDESDLEEAKREMIQNLDSPIAPGSRAEVAYSWFREGKTHEMRQAFRDAILQASCTDIVRAVEQHLATPFKEAKCVTFGPKELLEKENAKLISLSLPPLHIERIGFHNG